MKNTSKDILEKGLKLNILPNIVRAFALYYSHLHSLWEYNFHI